MTKQYIHATAVALKGRAVLLKGASGHGKSDLALRLIRNHGFHLVSDDQVVLQRKDKDILAFPPETIKGRMEIRGVGIKRFDYVSRVPVKLAVDLVTNHNERIPEPDAIYVSGIKIKRIILDPFETSVVEKLVLALEQT